MSDKRGYDLLATKLSRKQRVRVVDSAPSDLNVATAEDMVLQKLIWYWEGGSISDRQWGDVLGIVRTQGDRLDREYLDRWAGRKGLGDCSRAPTRTREFNSRP